MNSKISNKYLISIFTPLENNFLTGFTIAISLFLIFIFTDSVFASMAEDLIARESWRKISLDLEGANLINVLKVFSQQSGLNFVASQNVADRTITLYMENVPIREALDKILNTYNLTYELDEGSNIFIVRALVKPEVDTITRVYPLKYAQVNASALNTARTTSAGGFASTSSTSTTSTASTTGSTGGVSGVSFAGASIADVVQSILSSYGHLSEDARTNSLIITDIPTQFPLIEETIERLDVSVPQVIIEAEIIDTTKQLVDTLGMEWSSTLYNFTLASRTGLEFPFQGLTNITTAITAGSVSTPASTVSAALHLLKTDKDTKVLARPKILTLSNETATIRITGSNAVGTITTLDDQGNPVSTTPERYEIGVSLTVTPTVNLSTGEITMVLEPSVSSVEVSNISSTTFDPQQRTAKATVMLKDGETVVIGGLLRKDNNKTKKKVPILGDIPLVGSLFRHKALDDKDRELLVFITPRIVKTGSLDLVKSTETKYNMEILEQREQADYQNRKEEIDKALSAWDNK